MTLIKDNYILFVNIQVLMPNISIIISVFREDRLPKVTKLDLVKISRDMEIIHYYFALKGSAIRVRKSEASTQKTLIN